jgi:hypothetical protein
MPHKNKRPSARRQEPQTHYIGAGEIQIRSESSVRIKKHARTILGYQHPRRWQGDRIEIVLKELYPGGVPSPDQLSNAELVLAVQNRMRELGIKPLPSSDSILRAADRKKRS